MAAADVILHVRDVAHPDTAAQRRDVLKVLGEMAQGPNATLDEGWEARVMEVLNKADLLGGVSEAAGGDPGAVAVSALTGEGLPELRAAMDARLSAGLELVDYAIPAADGARLAWLYRHGEVVNREDREDGVAVTVRLSSADRARFEQNQTAAG